MTRRQLLALGILAPAAHAATVTYRNNPPYFPYLDLIESGHDEFPPDPPMPKHAEPRDGRFADITGAVLNAPQLEKGIPYWISHLDPATGIDIYGNNGIAVGDIDNDGRDEVYVCQPAGLPNRLYRWVGNQLTDITSASGLDLLDDTSSALFLDLRNLGRQDLVVLRGSGPVLYLNDGKGRFTLSPDAFHFDSSPQGGFTGMAAADYDRDGKVDLYLCTYSFFQTEAQFRYPVPYFDAQNGPANFLFRNQLNADGSGWFEDTTKSSGIDENNNRYSFAPAWCDYDNSGYPSLYVANDFGRNNLYRNVAGKFRDVAAEAGVEDIGPGMSACWFDENNSGHADLYVANMWTAVGQQIVRHPKFPHKLNDAWIGHTKGNSFYRNQGNGKFKLESIGLEMGRWGWSADAADFDNDGRPELYLTCGMLTGHKQPDLMGFFWRQVVSKTPESAVSSSPYENGWNAINQLIREGYSWNGNEPNVYYTKQVKSYRDSSSDSGVNYAADSRAFAVSDIDGDGCLDLLLKSRIAPQLRVLQNRCGQQNPRIAFRLIGSKSNRDAIGARIRLDGQTKWVTAGSGYLSQHTKTLHFGCGSGTKKVEISWPSGKTQAVANLTPGYLYEWREDREPVQVRAFDPPKPITPKPIRADNQPRLEDTWLQDPVPLPVPHKGPGLFILTEAEAGEHLAAYTLFRRYLFEFRAPLELPLHLLLNREGHVVKVYAKAPSESQLMLGDLPLVENRQPLPYAGKYLNQPRRDYFKLGAALLWCGYPEQSLPYLEAVLRQQPENVRTLTLVAQVHREAGRLNQAEPLLNEAIRLNPQSAEAWNELGGLAMAREDYATALTHFEQALTAKSGLAYAMLNAAQAADKLRRLPLAESWYRQALAADPQSPEANQGLGLTLAKLGRPSEAEALLIAATKLKPAFPTAWNNLGVLYLQAGDTGKAIRALEAGIAASPEDELLYLNLGRAYIQIKRPDQARSVMQRLLQAQPNSKVAQQALKDLVNVP